MNKGTAPLLAPELVVEFELVELAVVLASGAEETTVVMPLGGAAGLAADEVGALLDTGAEEALDELVDATGEAGVVSAKDAGPLEPSIWPAGAVEGGGVPVPKSWPAPQGMLSPSGCVALGGAVKAPVASVIAQRPVQVTLGMP